MATLQDFPPALIDEHMAWHMNTPGTPGGRSLTNRGLDFLNFHHAFMQKVFAWFNAKPEEYRSQYDLSPSWFSIPTELKTDPATGWNNIYAGYEQRIVTFSPPFLGEDDFGMFVENGIHNNYLHGACAVHYNDPNIGSPMTAPVISTWFYKIHGLVDNWRAAYKGHLAAENLNRRFAASVRVIFGVVNDGPGVVWTPNGPHPVDPWGPLVASVSPEIKQAVIGLALNHLAGGISDQRMRENAEHLGMSLLDRSVHAERSLQSH